MKRTKSKPLILTAIAAYTAIITYLMLFWRRDIKHDGYLYNLRPFKSIGDYLETYIRHNAFGIFAVNILGNIVMFVPFGILLGVLFNFKFIKSVVIFEVGLLVFETAQLISRRGVFDIDDIILNTIGFLLGYITVVIINNFRRVK